MSADPESAPRDDPFGAAARLEGVPSALAAARDGVDALLRDRGLRRTTPDVTGESLLRGAVASARLAGSASTLEEVRTGGGDDIARRVLRVNAELLALVPVVARSPLEAMARLHSLAAAGLVPAEELGRPSSQPSAAASLLQLSRRLLAPTAAPAIAVAALAHVDVVTSGAFAVAGDIVARALERLLLVARGVDPAAATVPEAGHLALEGGYRRALSAYRSDDAASVRGWLLHATAAITEGVEHSPLRADPTGAED